MAGPAVLLSGGEATVTVRGDGIGGRNQEFALALALVLPPGIHALSAGSDGIDGSSGAAGAFLTPDTLTRAQAAGLAPRDFLERNDSGTFFAQLGGPGDGTERAQPGRLPGTVGGRLTFPTCCERQKKPGDAVGKPRRHLPVWAEIEAVAYHSINSIVVG